jgi:uncharacterized protein YkwD
MTNRPLRRALSALPLALALVLPAPAAGAPDACAAAHSRPGEATRAQLEQTVLCLLNRERTSRDLSRLHSNDNLAEAARRHSRDMKRRSFFSHDSPGGASLMDRVRRAGFRGFFVGENIAWGSGSYAEPAHIVSGWMQSPGHRANILRSEFRQIGVGVAIGAPRPVGGVPAAIYTTDFGARR